MNVTFGNTGLLLKIGKTSENKTYEINGNALNILYYLEKYLTENYLSYEELDIVELYNFSEDNTVKVQMFKQSFPAIQFLIYAASYIDFNKSLLGQEFSSPSLHMVFDVEYYAPFRNMEYDVFYFLNLPYDNFKYNMLSGVKKISLSSKNKNRNKNLGSLFNFIGNNKNDTEIVEIFIKWVKTSDFYNIPKKHFSTENLEYISSLSTAIEEIIEKEEPSETPDTTELIQQYAIEENIKTIRTLVTDNDCEKALKYLDVLEWMIKK